MRDKMKNPTTIINTPEKPRQSKYIRKFIWLLAILYLLFPGGQAAACSYPDPYADIVCERNEEYFQETAVCIDKECKFQIIPSEELDSYFSRNSSHVLMLDDWEIGIFRGKKLEFYDYRDISEDIKVIGKICQGFTDEDLTTIEDHYIDWSSSSWVFNVELYSKARELKLEKDFVERERRISNCTTVNYEHVGQWIVSYDYEKGYCIETIIPVDDDCPDYLNLYNPFLLAWRLITQPNWAGFPQLVFMFTLIATVFFLIKRKEFRIFFKPKKLTIIGLIIPFVINTFFVVLNPKVFDGLLSIFVIKAISSLSIILGWIFLLVYIILSLVHYIICRKKLADSPEVTS